jgi:hypothetical protein
MAEIWTGVVRFFEQGWMIAAFIVVFLFVTGGDGFWNMPEAGLLSAGKLYGTWQGPLGRGGKTVLSATISNLRTGPVDSCYAYKFMHTVD